MDHFQGKYNSKSTSVKRLMREALELQEATEDYSAHPLEDNLFEWHFTIRGPPETEFYGGVYHGRILLPAEYPMKPPNIILLTPNGRFEVNKKICLSISGHHPETWQPSWSIRTALLALIAFMPTPGSGTIGSLDYTAEERKLLASKSHSYICPECGKITDRLLSNVSKPATAEEKSMIDCVAFKGEDATEVKAEKVALQPESVETERKDEPSVSEEKGDRVAEGLPSVRHRPAVSSQPDASVGSAPNTATATSGNISIVDRHRSLIIGVLVTAIGFLILRRLILI